MKFVETARSIKQLCLLVLLTLGYLTRVVKLYAQAIPESNLHSATVSASQTKPSSIHLHLDRSVYGRGESIWFNAYLKSHYNSPVGSTLQAELWKEDSLLSRVLTPIALGVSSGQFLLPADCKTGWYTIRAHTDQTSVAPFQASIYVVGKLSDPRQQQSTEPRVVAAKDSLRINFYPESGQLIAGIGSTVAFKVIDGQGRLRSLTGTIQNEGGQPIIPFSTRRYGRGEFYLDPVKEENYYAVWKEQEKTKRLLLPAVSTSGIALSIISHPEGFLFELNRKQEEKSKRGHWLVGTKDGALVFRQALSLSPNAVQGILRTKTLSSGTLTVSVLDSLENPLISRIVFVNNKEYNNTLSLRTDTFSLGAKAKNKWILEWPDSLRGTISVAVTDADMDGIDLRSASILSKTLLPYEALNEMEEADWYFNTNEDSAAVELDLLMMTRGNNTDQENKDDRLSTPIGNSVAIEKKGYITLKGQAFLQGTRQPLTQAKLIVILSAARLRNNILFTETDASGRFSIDSLLFFGPARLIFADYRMQKKSRPIDIKLEDNKIQPLAVLAPSPWEPAPITDQLETEKVNEIIRRYDKIVQEAEGLTLEEVTIKTRVKTPLEKLQEQYTSGAFETDAFVERAIDLVNTDEANTYANIFEYLRFRVPGLQVVDPDYSQSPPGVGQDMRNDPTKYRIFYRQLPSASSMGNPPMAIYLNEIEVDADILLTIPAAEIALVKLFSSFAAAQGGGPGGALAIYTKKPELLRENKSNAVSFYGYDPIKSFPIPDYELDTPLREKTDQRITLFWQSNFFMNNASNKMPIRFFNNDRTKRYRIVVEGWTTEGQPLYLEKILE